MTLLNSMVLAIGGLLLAVPIILHFLMKPKPQELTFPALKFIKKKQIKNRRQMRVRHLVLLILRCLLILVIAAALAGPTVATGNYSNWMTLGIIGFAAILVGLLMVASWFRKGNQTVLLSILGLMLVGILGYGGWVGYKLTQTSTAPIIGNTQAPVAAVLIIDTSPRMLYQKDNRNSLEKAQELGEWLIKQFPLDSQVSILMTDGDSPFFSVDVASAKKRLATAKVSFTPASIPDALSEGLELLKSSDLERKEIYVLSDLTLRSWSNSNSKQLADRLTQETSTLYVLDVGTEKTLNFSINEIRLESSSLALNSLLKIEADILRRGPAAERTVRMQLEKKDRPPVFQDGKSIFPSAGWENSQLATLTENGAMTLQFVTSQRLEPGIHHGKIEIIGNDGLSIDDEKYFTVDVREAWKILLIHPKNLRTGQMRATIETEPIFRCETVLESELSSIQLSDYNAVYWLNPTPISDTTWETLRRYVEGGGGLGMMLGHNAQNGPVADSAFTTEAAQRILTGKLTFPYRAPKPDRPGIPRGYFLSPDNLAHPILAEFRSIADTIDWTRYPVLLHWGLIPDNSAEYVTQTILDFNDQESALVERQIGKGRVLVMTTPIPEVNYPKDGRESWNQLFPSDNFPTWLLLLQMTKHLVGTDADRLNLKIAQTAVLNNDPNTHPEKYNVFTPDSEKSPTESKPVDDVLRYKFTSLPGHYRLLGNLLGPVLRGFSVNLGPADTDLTRVKPEQLDTILGAGNYQLAIEKEEIQRKQGAMREGQSFYPMLILLMLLVLAIEYLMSNRFYGRANRHHAAA